MAEKYIPRTWVYNHLVEAWGVVEEVLADGRYDVVYSDGSHGTIEAKHLSRNSYTPVNEDDEVIEATPNTADKEVKPMATKTVKLSKREDAAIDDDEPIVMSSAEKEDLRQRFEAMRAERKAAKETAPVVISEQDAVKAEDGDEPLKCEHGILVPYCAECYDNGGIARGAKAAALLSQHSARQAKRRAEDAMTSDQRTIDALRAELRTSREREAALRAALEVATRTLAKWSVNVDRIIDNDAAGAMPLPKDAQPLVQPDYFQGHGDMAKLMRKMATGLLNEVVEALTATATPTAGR